MKKVSFLFITLLYSVIVYSLPITYTVANEILTYNNSTNPQNESPIAHAGTDIEAFEGDTIVLDGSFSSDPDDDHLNFQWSAPSGIILNDITIAKPSFVVPTFARDTIFTFALLVSDEMLNSDIDLVSITIRKQNKEPVAIAGPDVEKFEGDTTTLDGSRSYDPEGKRLTYKWTTLEGITLNASEYSRIPFTIPNYLRDTILVISLVVHDGFQYSNADKFSIKVSHINLPPVANAGRKQEVDEGDAVTLNGSSSYDPEKKPIHYNWKAPKGITLSSPDDPKPTFTAPEVSSDTTYIFTLVVNDGIVDSDPEQVKLTVRQVNKAPISHAGVDFAADEGTQVALDGSLSFDADKDILKYLWTTPRGITLSDKTISRPTFTAPEVSKDTTYIFTLVVNDGKADSQPVLVKINVRQVNKAPTANAIIYQEVNEGDMVTLDGSLSADADNDVLNYKWTAPKEIVLQSPASDHPSFTAPEVYADTVYNFVLLVDDGKVDSPPRTVTVLIRNVVKPIYFKVYPVPSTGVVFVEFLRISEKCPEISVSTMNGDVLIRRKICERTISQIDLTGYPNGLYILTVIHNNLPYSHKILLHRD